MKRRCIAAAACSCVFIIAFFGTIILLKTSLPSGAAQAVEATIVSETETTVKAEEKYIIKEYGGNICVFHGDYQDIPAVITDIAVDTLTTNDRELLFQGIEVFGRQELLKLLEDYS